MEVAADLRHRYGPYPMASTFAATDAVPELAETEEPVYSAAFDTDPSSKRHSACDECS